MGILPMQFTQGENADVLGLDGSEIYHIEGIQELSVNKPLVVIAQKSNGKLIRFSAIARLNTEVELEIYRNGGILQTVLRRLLRS
jgi:aconitate hydratase